MRHFVFCLLLAAACGGTTTTQPTSSSANVVTGTYALADSNGVPTAGTLQLLGDDTYVWQQSGMRPQYMAGRWHGPVSYFLLVDTISGRPFDVWYGTQLDDTHLLIQLGNHLIQYRFVRQH